ncbi:MAG: hypothetical protein D6706_10910 [Chloroflexi bacterium]|nr:MAG: hypothetical protein D6706_10910 [Chloroflexota bacterium]
MRRITSLLLLIMVGMTILAACTLGGPDTDACAGGGALFFDDFSADHNCGWAVYSRSGAVVEVVDGVLRISTSQPGEIWWTNPGRNFDDVIITTQARQVSGPDNNAYGVICRYQNEENFYIFLISGDGFYAIAKYESESPQVQYLSGGGQYQFSDIINQGVATNQIRASCIGNELTLTVNGLPLVTVTDDSFVAGDIGLGVSTLEPGTAVVEFDQVQVIQP